LELLRKIFKSEKRTMTTKDADGWVNIGNKTNSGVNVSMETVLSVPAALSAIRLLSESVASLPLVLYRKSKVRERAQEHPLYALLHDQVNHRHSPFQFKEMIMLNLLTNGNAYALIDGTNLWVIQSSRVTPKQDDQGIVTYEITTKQGKVTYRAKDILHITGLSFDGLVGKSPISLARETLGTAVAEIQHGSSFFKNSSIPSGIISHPGQLSENGQSLLKQSWNAAYGGSASAGKVAILEEGMEFKPINFNNKDSQWLESRAFTVKEIARIFRVPPHLLGDLEKASYASIEQQNLDFLTYSLRPWLCRIEEAINLQLLTDKERDHYYVEFLTADLLRADTKNRFESYQTALQSGWLTVNEVRKFENMPAIKGADRLFTQLNTAPLVRQAKLGITGKVKVLTWKGLANHHYRVLCRYWRQ